MTMRRAPDGRPSDREAALRPVGYASGKGAIFLSHSVRNIDEEGGIWHADAVYSVSPDLPAGAQVIRAATAVAGCAEQGIPTV